MNRKERIFKKISKKINCDFLEVVNNSHLHKGHSGDDGTLETHFRVIIKSSDLSKLSRVSSHKAVNKVLLEEYDDGLHALEIEIIR